MSAAFGAQATPEFVEIEGGIYTLGSSNGQASARPVHEISLAAYEIGKYEITNEQFSEFLNATADIGVYIELDDPDARIHRIGGRYRPMSGFENHPITEATWYGARDYCAWIGGRLPSEAHWEAAARGIEGRTYPWGEAEPSRRRANFAGKRGDTAVVGSHPSGATPDGIHDLAGNVAEWTSSLFWPYPYEPDDGREDPLARGERVTRGGDYIYDTATARLTTYFRDGFSRRPESGHRHIGFRCAREN